jgi:hypothetical protein
MPEAGGSSTITGVDFKLDYLISIVFVLVLNNLKIKNFMESFSFLTYNIIGD